MANNSSENLSEFGSSNFIVKNAEGVFVDFTKLDSSEQFMLFAERVFSSGYYFAGLEYGAFLELICSYTPEKISETLGILKERSKSSSMRFASEILAFPPERQSLYRPPRIVSGNAEYLFEPVMIEKIIEEPLFAENEDGLMEVVGTEKRTVSEKSKLSFDEFVAAMWAKGIRYGIDAEAVKGMISSGKSGRLVFARPLAPQGGQDSGLMEQTDRLHRDNSPRELPNGKIDLRQFRNRFPQIRQGERLLKKTPRNLGAPGRDLACREIAPPLPKDFDLEQLAGEGTHIERTAEGEFIVSSMDGFLNIDTKTNRIAVLEKIVNYGGVSMKTTGDLSLDGEHFEEHGEIQEKRVVEGKSITVLGDVFGTVVSTGGKIHFKQNLVGGSATNQDGDIAIDGLASNALIHAKYGKVSLKRAENSSIIGQHVLIEQAINCTILGETVEIESSEGSAIAGKNIRIAAAAPRKENQTIVSVLIPDLSGFKKRNAEIGTRISGIDLEIEALRKKTEPLAGQKEVRNYLIIAGKLQRKEITLSEEQKSSWQKMGANVAPMIKAISAINQEIQSLQGEKESLLEEAVAIEEEEQQASSGISCSIRSLTRDTLVRKWMIQAVAPSLFDMKAKELRIRLRDGGLPEERLPHSGELDWKY